jgi:hypothetical protein
LDDGGKTADEAVIKFAENVLNKFGDYSWLNSQHMLPYTN